MKKSQKNNLSQDQENFGKILDNFIFEFKEDRFHIFSKKLNNYIDNLTNSKKGVEPFVFEFIDNINCTVLFEFLNKFFDEQYIDLMSLKIFNNFDFDLEDQDNIKKQYQLFNKYFTIEIDVFINSLSYNNEFIKTLNNDNKIIDSNIDHYILKFKTSDLDINSNSTNNIYINQQALALSYFCSNLSDEKVNLDFSNLGSIVNKNHILKRLNINKKIGVYSYNIKKYNKLRKKLTVKEDPYLNLQRCEFSNTIKLAIFSLLNNRARFDNIKFILLKINLKIKKKRKVSIVFYKFFLCYLYYVKLFVNQDFNKNKL